MVAHVVLADLNRFSLLWTVYPVSVGVSKPLGQRVFFALQGLDYRLQSFERLGAHPTSLSLKLFHSQGILVDQLLQHLALGT